jgi:ATP-dependent Clp endopeptidase proteolytic subunit ClpP
MNYSYKAKKAYKNNLQQNPPQEEEEEEGTGFNITMSNNDIYFYEEITPESVLLLSTYVKKLESKLLHFQCDYKLKNPPSIYIYIHSYGGDVYAGLSCMNMLEKCRVPVVTIVDGFVASAATFLLLGGHKRWMREHSQILIHQIRGSTWGKYDDLKDEMENSEKLMTIIQDIYVSKSEIPEKKIRKIIKKELTMTSEKCLQYKLIDKIL